MKGFRLNPNKEHVDTIMEGLQRKDGHCPCKIQQIPENLCPCDEFINTGDCHCNLWVRVESKTPCPVCGKIMLLIEKKENYLHCECPDCDLDVEIKAERKEKDE